MQLKRTLIFTVAVNYEFSQLKAFINSILINCPRSDIIFFCDNKVKEIILHNYPIHHGRFLFYKIDFYTEYKIKKGNFLFNFVCKIVSFFILINNYLCLKKKINIIDLNNLTIGKYIFINSHFLLRRFIWYSKIDKKILDKYSYIVLSDCRDVIFQSDPFEILKNTKEFLVSGYEPELIHNNKINKKWLLEAYKKNQKVYSKLLNSPIICAGVTLGSTQMVFDYLEEMRSEIKNYIITNKKASITNLDQIFHNKIFAFTNNDEINIDKSNKLISTLGFTEKFDIKLDYKSKKVIVDGNIPSIIHQYDRNRLLSKNLLNWFSNL